MHIFLASNGHLSDSVSVHRSSLDGFRPGNEAGDLLMPRLYVLRVLPQVDAATLAVAMFVGSDPLPFLDSGLYLLLQGLQFHQCLMDVHRFSCHLCPLLFRILQILPVPIHFPVLAKMPGDAGQFDRTPLATSLRLGHSDPQMLPLQHN